jgi:hypothetical protein
MEPIERSNRDHLDLSMTRGGPVPPRMPRFIQERRKTGVI